MDVVAIQSDPTAHGRCAGGGGSPDGSPAAAPIAARAAHARGLRIRKPSAWSSLAVKAVAVGAGMVGLACIGASSLLAGGGVDLARVDAAAFAPTTLGSEWLAPPRAAPPPVPSRRPPTAPAASGRSTADRRSEAFTPDGRIILNRATAEELTRLPGIGAKRAEAIVALRSRLKRFRRPRDLLRVRGIGIKSLRRLEPHVSIDPPAEPARLGAEVERTGARR